MWDLFWFQRKITVRSSVRQTTPAEYVCVCVCVCVCMTVCVYVCVHPSVCVRESLEESKEVKRREWGIKARETD